jgi:hypothetical protein
MKYDVLPGGLKSKNNPQLFEAAYDFWYNSWTNFFRKQDPQFTINPNEFFRQDAIGVLSLKDSIVGIHLYSEFDLSLKICQMHEYLNQNFTPKFFIKLQNKNLMNVMTFEGLMISPEFRKSFTGVSLAPVLVGLSYQYLLSKPHVQAMIAPARSDNGVAQLGLNSGCDILEEIVLHGTPVALLLGQRENIQFNYLNKNEKTLANQLFEEFLVNSLNLKDQNEYRNNFRKKSA